MPSPEELFHPVSVSARDWEQFQRSQVVKEWVRRLRSEIYQRSRRRGKDDGDWREQQGLLKGLELALSIPRTILTESAEPEPVEE